MVRFLIYEDIKSQKLCGWIRCRGERHLQGFHSQQAERMKLPSMGGEGQKGKRESREGILGCWPMPFVKGESDSTIPLLKIFQWLPHCTPSRTWKYLLQSLQDLAPPTL